MSNQWGIYGTWLEDNSNIKYRQKGDSEWIEGKVLDDRYYTDTCKIVPSGIIYHVTKTSKDCIDFSLDKNLNNSSLGNYEVFIKS